MAFKKWPDKPRTGKPKAGYEEVYSMKPWVELHEILLLPVHFKVGVATPFFTDFKISIVKTC